jgi:serine/threonine-protein kinase
LFEDKLAAQKEALMQGKQLADIIEMQHQMSSPDATMELHGSGPHAASTQSIPSAARTVTDVSGVGIRAKSNNLLVAGIVGLIALVMIGGGVGYVVKKKTDNDARAATATPAIAPVVKGSVVVESTPPGASIWINGDLRSELTPATISQLPIGQPLDIKLTMDGFEQTKQSVTLKEGEPAKVKVDLKKGSVVVEVKVTPENLSPTFTLDGKPAPGAKIDGVASGVSHKLVVSAAGYTDQTVTFTGSPMETKHLDVTLEKAPEPKHGTSKPASTSATAPPTPAPAPAGNGKINVGASGGWCNVTIDGAARGATPVAGVELSAGPHRVTCTTPDGKTQTATVVVPADGVARHKFTL